MLGARIAALRRGAGFSQAELAQRLRISPSAVGMYEQGRREPPLDILVQMAQLFRVSTDYLLTGKAGSEEDARASRQAWFENISLLEASANRRGRSFSRQELAVLFAAMLMEP